MMGLITIFVFVVLLAFPGFFIITRKIFPKKSKKSATWISIFLTVILLGLLALGLVGNPV